MEVRKTKRLTIYMTLKRLEVKKHVLASKIIKHVSE